MLSIILILLFLFSILSVPVCQGVISGLYLFGMKVFPGLFISFIVTNVLVRVIEYKKINSPWIIVIVGLMTGFPNGAYICSWYHKNNPESRLADMLAGIINIPSPAFLISYVYINILEKCIDIYTFLIITYLPVIICSVVITALFNDNISGDKKVRNKVSKGLMLQFFEEAVDSSISTALKLGAYIILFSVIVNLVVCLIPQYTIALIITCPLEISNGLAIIKNSGLATDVFVLMTVLLDSFGGLCIVMQTKCVCKHYISIKKYIYQKLVLCVVTLITAMLLIYVL
ncbi:MAG: hypothetical protein Q4E78_07940 [Eubacteriales bacterium]|nr:hypothetical protein [Eubacteriales bacterium]